MVLQFYGKSAILNGMETIEITGSIGERIRELREAKGWTQIDLARESQIPQADISKLETGARRVGRKYAHKLARVLGVPFHTLLEPINF